jgi:hypothetical protein
MTMKSLFRNAALARRFDVRRIGLILTMLIPLLGLLSRPPDIMALLYSVFGVVYLFRGRLKRTCDAVPVGAAWKLTLLFLLTGALTEGLAWTNNYLKEAKEPALFHPQLIPDLIIGIGFYGGWAAAWLIALRWFRFSTPQAFVLTGLQGIFFEQLGAVFQAMLAVLSTNPPMSVVFGLYVFAVHGSIAGIALAPVLPDASQPDPLSRSAHWMRYPIAVVLMVGLAFAGCAVVDRVAKLFGGLPPKQSIVEHPLW